MDMLRASWVLHSDDARARVERARIQRAIGLATGAGLAPETHRRMALNAAIATGHPQWLDARTRKEYDDFMASITSLLPNSRSGPADIEPRPA